jgi:ABC-2 type transport system ATP-binding protein
MAKMNGQDEHAAIITVSKIMKEIGIVDIGGRNPNSFSSGQKKKVLLAQSLLSNPSILIMDEPTAMLDPGARKDLFDQLAKLRKQGKSIFISSHVLTELEKYADSVTIIDKGKLVFTGDINEINNKVVGNLYVVNTNSQSKLKTFCQHHKFYCTTIKNNFCVQINNNDIKSSLLEFIAKQKILLTDFYLYKPKLEDMYDKLISLTHHKGVDVK